MKWILVFFISFSQAAYAANLSCGLLRGKQTISAFQLSKIIQSVLTPDVLTKTWSDFREEIILKGNPEKIDLQLFGHCYAATEALYHLLGGKKAGLTPMRIATALGTHWYLRTKEGKYIDLSAKQFSVVPDHSKGIGAGFLTREPSHRAQEIIKRVKEKLKRE